MTIQAINDVIAERDEILRAMDVERAKAFIVTHGALPPKRIDWERVFHLARFEVTTPEMAVYRRESHIWLGRNGGVSMMHLSPTSPYVRAALDLIFPLDLTNAWIGAMS